MRAEQASEWSTFCTTFWGKDKLKEPAPGVVVKMRKYEAEKQVPDLGEEEEKPTIKQASEAGK